MCLISPFKLQVVCVYKESRSLKLRRLHSRTFSDTPIQQQSKAAAHKLVTTSPLYRKPLKSIFSHARCCLSTISGSLFLKTQPGYWTKAKTQDSSVLWWLQPTIKIRQVAINNQRSKWAIDASDFCATRCTRSRGVSNRTRHSRRRKLVSFTNFRICVCLCV